MANHGLQRTKFPLSWVLILLLAAPLCSRGQSTNLLSRLEPIPPFPELQAAAKAAGIPLEGMSSDNNSLAPGNSITALITLHQKGNRLSQWLVYFEVVDGTNDTKPEKPMVLYNSLGDKFEFVRSPITFNIRTIGPYLDSESFWGNPVPKDKQASADADGAFLSLGLDKGAATIYRLKLAEAGTAATNFELWAWGKAPPASKAAKNRKLAAMLHVTGEEERAVAAWYPALSSYFDSVGQTPSLESIMLKVVHLPSLWSIVKHASITAYIGINPNGIHPLALPAQWNLPGHAPVYTLPMFIRLNNQPALNATLLVTDPRAPLLACGGIVGFVAENPVDSENYMILRVISAR